MQAIELKRGPNGVSLQTILRFKIKSSMGNSRRRMRVHTRKIRAGMEQQFPGITFDRFEVVFTKHKARMYITPSREGMAILNQHFSKEQA